MPPGLGSRLPLALPPRRRQVPRDDEYGWGKTEVKPGRTAGADGRARGRPARRQGDRALMGAQKSRSKRLSWWPWQRARPSSGAGRAGRRVGKRGRPPLRCVRPLSRLAGKGDCFELNENAVVDETVTEGRDAGFNSI
jgi:hypothetical protein